MTDETRAETVAPQPAGTFELGAKIGKYTLVRELGTGGMGVVWAAHDPDLDREIAIKVLRGGAAGDTARRRFLREARAMAKLKHPNVLTVYEAATSDGRDYIAMELVDGSNLATWLASPRKRDEVWAALLAAGRGLSAAHEAGLVHRDFKPHNVLIRRDGRVLVTDFGLVRTVGEDSLEPPGEPLASPVSATDATAQAAPRTGDKLTHTGTVMGTPAYMAPEQFSGSISDPRTDQFAFCITAWQALTGKRPFRGTSIDELERAVREPPDLAAPLARELRAVIARGLAAEPEQRFSTMAALLDAFDHARRAPRRRRIAIAIAAAIAVAFAIAIVTWKLRAPPWVAEIRTLEPTYDENSDAPEISYDGNWIVFGAGRGTNPAWQVYTMPVSGGEPHVVSRPDCGWSTRWDRNGDLLIVCGKAPETTLRAFRQPMRGDVPVGPPIDLGPAAQAEPCGDRLLVIVQTASLRYLAERLPDGHDRMIQVNEVQRVRCDRTGEHVLFETSSRASGPDSRLWIEESGRRRLLVSGGIVDFAFTPDARSVVIARHDNNHYDLQELTLDDGELHQLTTSADARAVDVSLDGSVLLFDKDVTTIALFDHHEASPQGEQKSFDVEILVRPAVMPDGKRVVVESVDTGAIVIVDLETKHVRVLVSKGRSPFPSRDGTRVYFVADADHRRLDAVPVDGGDPVVIAQLPQTIVDGVDAADGIHVEIGKDQLPFRRTRYQPTFGWKVAADGTTSDEHVGGLVFPSDSGWRAIRVPRPGGAVLQFVKPGAPLDAADHESPINGRPAWIADHELGLCTIDACMRIDTSTGAPIGAPTPIATDLRAPFAVSPDGRHWYSTHAVGHVTRQTIVNFADRPWKP